MSIHLDALKVVLIAPNDCIQLHIESRDMRAVPQAQVDVKVNLTSKKLQQCVSAGRGSSFVLFPIMLMVLKSWYVHAWMSNGPAIPQCFLVGNQEETYCEMMCFSDHQLSNEKAINRICLHSMGRFPSHLIRSHFGPLLPNLRLSEVNITQNKTIT